MKKADLSINVIIVAVIALIVLVVLLLVFTGKMSIFSKVMGGCASKPGSKCYTADVSAAGKECPIDNDAGNLVKMDFDCPENEVCCYSQCLSVGGECKASCDGSEANMGSANCQGNYVCCK